MWESGAKEWHKVVLGFYNSGRYKEVFISSGMTLHHTLYFHLEKHVSVGILSL